ncbi:MAG: hypothetical protein HOV77_11835 [Hamadaea sp.]|uniref:LVIVD repeat-containing protein n=1 Tax=Hamadaea sp. TaxID=2024425 RepID=UPI0017FFCC55|nr:hypothetical protein [Hamadaea sp.]NUT19871.1 hypothetical protein [Hamadaea sp.]
MKARRTLVLGLTLLLAGFGTAAPAAGHDEGPPPPPTGESPTTTSNMHLLAHVNPGPGTNADVYGHRGYAYLASWSGWNCFSNGVRVYDLRDPARPQHVSTFGDAASEPSLAGTWTEKVVVQRVDTPSYHGDVAVVTFQTCGSHDDVAFRGFALYDVTDPAHPTPLARYATPGARGSHEIWLGAHGGKAYVYTAVLRSEWTSSPTYDPATNTATTPGRADFRIVDITDPRHPADVGEWGAWKELGVVPVENPASPYSGKQNFTHSVRVDERLTTAYLSYWDLGTVILDIRDPAHPRYLGKTDPEQGATHSSVLSPDGKTLIETHETLGGLPMIYDVSDPRHPVELAHFDIPGGEENSVHDPKLRGGRAYFSWYALGVVVADVSRPSSPKFLGQFVPDDWTPNPDYCDYEGGCSEIWGVYVMDDLILASDMNNGLYVLRMA